MWKYYFNDHHRLTFTCHDSSIEQHGFTPISTFIPRRKRFVISLIWFSFYVKLPPRFHCLIWSIISTTLLFRLNKSLVLMIFYKIFAVYQWTYKADDVVRTQIQKSWFWLITCRQKFSKSFVGCGNWRRFFHLKHEWCLFFCCQTWRTYMSLKVVPLTFPKADNLPSEKCQGSDWKIKKKRSKITSENFKNCCWKW